MAQRTPIATPPRRQNERNIATPASARSVATPTTSTPAVDRATLQDRLDSIELQIRDLRGEIAAERQRRATSSQRKRDKERATFAASSTAQSDSFTPLSVLDGSNRTAPQMKELLLERLKILDDNALTALLTASTASLAAMMAGQSQTQAVSSTYLIIDAGLVPSKSVGIEGVGSGSEIDRRLLLASDTDLTSKRQRGVQTGDVAGSLRRARHAESVHHWLKDRQRRSTALIDSLVQFTYLDIESVKQADVRNNSRAASSASTRRNIVIKGTFARLFSLELRFDVIEHPSEVATTTSSSTSAPLSVSPEIQNLKVTVPPWLQSTLDEQHSHFTKLVRRNDLPAVLLTLRTLIPLISLRRNVFTSLMVRYTDLVREHVRGIETGTKVQYQPWQPNTPRGRAGPGSERSTNEALAKSLIVPQFAESLTLKNSKGARLDLHFRIKWNRYGHASPELGITPHVPSHLANATVKAFLPTLDDSFRHLIGSAIRQTAEITLSDMRDEEDFDPSIGRFGIMPAINATIQAFFGLNPSRPRAPNVDSDEDADSLPNDDV